MTAPPTDPVAGSPPVFRRAARATVPGGPAVPGPPPGTAGGKTSAAAPDLALGAAADPDREAGRVPAGRSSLPGPACLQPAGPGTSSPAGGALEGARGVPAGSRVEGLPRRWVLELPPGMELLSLNGREHWSARNRKTQALKDAAIVLVRKAKIPPLERVSVVAEYQPPDRRHRDPDNIALSAKAVIDGCRIAGLIPQDDSRHVLEVTCRIGELYPKGRLVLTVTEVAA